MPSFVGVDAASKSSGSNRCLIGVLIEVGDLQSFRDHYVDTVTDWYDEYGIERKNPVIKSDHISRLLPSYRISTAKRDLEARLLDTEEIDRVSVCLAWHEGAVSTPLGEFGGGEFINKFVKGYFPVVTLWQYHRSNRQYDPVERAVLDSFEGKISEAWKYVGNEFQFEVVPKGDLTYPTLSTADLVSAALSTAIPNDAEFHEFETHTAGWLRANLPEDGAYVDVNELSQESADSVIRQIKPHKYDVRPHLHYPHPVFFVQEDVLSGKQREAIDRSQLLEQLCDVARRRSGCVTRLDPESFPFSVQDGDYLVYNPVEPDIPRTLSNLHPDTDITTVPSTDVSRSM